MISVIIPVFNVKPFLNEAVDSVIGQSFAHWEMILVDDGSTDGCSEICDSYAAKDSRIKVIHQKNGGLSAARNTGLNLCKGEYISFLDSDDSFYPDMLSTALEALQKHDADIVEFNISVNSRQLFHTNEGSYSNRQAMIMQIEGKVSTAVWNKFYRRELWDGIRFTEGRNYEDLEVILPVLEKAKSIYVISEPLVSYRLRQESITFTRSLRNLQDYTLSFRNYAGYIESHIPEFFTQDHLERAYQESFSYLLMEYCTCSISKIPEKKPILNFLRQELDYRRRKIDTKNSNFKTRASYFLVKHFPSAVPLIYRLYRKRNEELHS